MKHSANGVLIVFEGIDGTGKSTQLLLLKEFLEAKGHKVVATREPTDGPFGQKIRALYQNRSSVTVKEELELFLADRKEHVNTLIKPSLAAGKIVLCDRYYLSTAAYQGAAGMDPEVIIRDNGFAPPPDLAFILEQNPIISIERITKKRGDTLNDFEQLESLQKVSNIFSEMKFSYIRRIDATGPIEEVHNLMKNYSLDIILKKMVHGQQQAKE